MNDIEKVLIDGIPIEDYGRPTSQTVYSNNYNFVQMGALQGWQCPICKRILAPFVQECPCKGEGIQTMTVATRTMDLKGDKNEIYKIN